MLRPILGDTVHSVSYGTTGGQFPASCHAAIVAWVHPTEPGSDDVLVDLHVFKPWGTDIRPYVLHDVGLEVPQSPPLMCGSRAYPGGTWHWPDAHR